MSRTSRQKGKRVEREIAAMLGTKRNPADGHSHTDIYTERFAVEVKARKALPEWIHSAMEQAEADLKEGRDTPVVVLVESTTGQKPRRYVLLRFNDFVTITKGNTNDQRG